MQRAWVFGHTAVLVFPWWEPDPVAPERGVRIELRSVRPSVHRGSPSAAQEVSIDAPLWRADLFDREGDGPGTFRSAHFHPSFDGVEPSERHWDESLSADPLGWLDAQLADLGAIAPSAPADEAVLLRSCRAEIAAAAQAVLDQIWSSPSGRGANVAG